MLEHMVTYEIKGNIRVSLLTFTDELIERLIYFLLPRRGSNLSVVFYVFIEREPVLAFQKL
jgi:hypothetical protein